MAPAARRLRFGGLPPVTLATLVLLVAAYIVLGFGANVVGVAAPLVAALPLRADAVLGGEAWRLVTYGLIHASPLHLLLNGLMLWWFGADVERRVGSATFAAFLVTAVVVGGLAVTGAWSLGIGAAGAVGFSAAVEACIVAWALWNRHTPVNFWMVLPMRGIHMLWLAILMWVLEAVSPSSGTSAAAHFGGIVTGFAAWFLLARRNRVRLAWDEVLMKLRLRRGPRLTVVPKKSDKWVN